MGGMPYSDAGSASLIGFGRDQPAAQGLPNVASNRCAEAPVNFLG